MASSTPHPLTPSPSSLFAEEREEGEGSWVRGWLERGLYGNLRPLICRDEVGVVQPGDPFFLEGAPFQEVSQAIGRASIFSCTT